MTLFIETAINEIRSMIRFDHMLYLKLRYETCAEIG